MTAFLTNAWLGIVLVFVGGLYLWHRQNKLEARLRRLEKPGTVVDSLTDEESKVVRGIVRRAKDKAA